MLIFTEAKVAIGLGGTARARARTFNTWAACCQQQDLILLVYEGVNLAKEKLQDVPGEVLYFRKKPVLKDVMAVVERVAGRFGRRQRSGRIV